jgi:NADH-quinone oxidoreductase subunit K
MLYEDIGSRTQKTTTHPLTPSQEGETYPGCHLLSASRFSHAPCTTQQPMNDFLTITPTHYLFLGAILFSLGVLGVLLRRSAIIVFLSIELMLNAVNLTFVALSNALGNIDGQVVVFFVMTVAAAEVAVGLALIVALYRTVGTTDIDTVHELKG